MLIVYRVVTQRSWERKTVDMAITSMAFASESSNNRGLEESDAQLAQAIGTYHITVPMKLNISEVRTGDVSDSSVDCEVVGKSSHSHPRPSQ